MKTVVISCLLPLVALVSCQSTSALTTSQIDAFRPYANFAAAGYCDPSQTIKWTCGPRCDANPKFLPVASGGDGIDVQYWYVGYDPSLNAVVVSYQGTSAGDLMSELNSDGSMSSLDPFMFPGLPPSIEVCSQFHDMFTRSATDVLSAVRTAMSTHIDSSVAVVGHSLGGALATLAAVYLPLWLPSNTTFRTITFGQPRVGNQAFADYVDVSCRPTRVNNKKDPIPIVPGRFLGYASSSGEIHIGEADKWIACPGQDNYSTECSAGDVHTIFDGDVDDNIGPYDGIIMRC